MSKQQEHINTGPWTARINPDLTWRIEDSIGLLVATVTAWTAKDSPDARLIAAAPDMLRLLRVLSEKSESGADTKDEWYVWRDAMQEAKALIARLDGGE